MKETKLATVETKIIKHIFGVEKYAVVELIRRYNDLDYFSHYDLRISSIHESKEDAIKWIQDNDSYGAFIVPMTRILKEQYVQS